jgi:hypothetical protein
MMRSGDGVLDAVLSDDAGLRSVLREAIGAEHAAVADWRWQHLPAGAGAGTRLFRVSGTAAAKGRPVPWRAIVKVLTGDVESFASSSAEQGSWDYWKREWHVYRSSWQASLPGPFVPPRCYGT